jgi:phosphate uptake regulator
MGKIKTAVMAAIVVAMIATIGTAAVPMPVQAAELSGELTIAGSTTVLPINQECARVLMVENPELRISVSGGGSGHGVKAVGEGAIDIPRMSEISQGMLSDCLEAFSTGEIKKLEIFSERDDEIDALFDQIRRELMTILIEKPRGFTNASHLLFVALHLERIGDHACNIASRVIYMVTGERRKLE